MACDLQATFGKQTMFKIATKILKLEGDVPEKIFGVNKCLIGFAGDVNEWGEVVNYLLTLDGKPPKTKNLEMLMLTDKKQLFHGNNIRNWTLMLEPHYSIGSGQHFALGALAAGHTTKQAVKAAMEYDPFTGRGIKEYSIA